MENGRVDRCKEAIECISHNKLKDAFEIYCSLFFPKSLEKSSEFKAFFRFQLAQYLCQKPNYTLALCEGDMISDLIEMTYADITKEIEDSDIKVSQSGRINILESIEIVFPCQSETKINSLKLCASK